MTPYVPVYRQSTRLPIDATHLVVAHELKAEEEASATHVADKRVSILQLAEALHRVLAHDELWAWVSEGMTNE